MSSVAQARAAMLDAIAPLGAEGVELSQALGRTLAAPVIAGRDQPPFHASAMDGYALCAADTPGGLDIVGEAAAGRGYARALKSGEAVRISTGAPLPQGADCVLAQEDARVTGDKLDTGAIAPGRHVRPLGGDFSQGEILLPQGRLLDAVALALAASTGAEKLLVMKQPRVSILCGGNEIIPPGASPRADQIFDSCSYGVEALAKSWGAMVTRQTPLGDDIAAIEPAAAAALKHSDLVVFIGAASVGPHDHARAAFEKLGAELRVRKIDMRPGKPTWFARTPGAPVLGLPGNPASALVCAALFLHPILAKLQGREAGNAFKRALLAQALPANGAREAYLRARVESDEAGQIRIDAGADQDSSRLTVFAGANALLHRPPGAPAASVGDIVAYLAWPNAD